MDDLFIELKIGRYKYLMIVKWFKYMTMIISYMYYKKNNCATIIFIQNIGNASEV